MKRDTELPSTFTRVSAPAHGRSTPRLRIHRSGICRLCMRSSRALGFPLLVILLHLLSVPARAYFGSFSPDGAQSPGPTTSSPSGDVPTIEALRLGPDASISLDGRLDDAVWSEAAGATGFRTWDPERGAPGYQSTVFKVAYDQDAVYFAFACAEPDPKKITKKLARRDRESDSDGVGVYLDPYHDLSSGYFFFVNPVGVQQDGTIFDDGQEDTGWDTVWQAETFQDADGWYAEMRIPFSSIRYRSDITTWGLNAFRKIHARGEMDAWVVWDRETPGFVSRFGHLAGIEGVRPPRQLALLPYLLARATDPSTPAPEEMDHYQNFGTDLMYGITSNLALNATIQPDFGQVEVDPALLNLSPFEIPLEEKRPFFTEGSRLFAQQAFELFYSRRIGIGDENSRIRGAAKLTGKTEDGVSVGTLVAVTDVTGHGQNHNPLIGGTPQTNFFIGRVGKEFQGGKRRIGVMQTVVARPGGRDLYGDLGSREAYTTGADFSLLMKDRRYRVNGSFVGSVISPEAFAADPAVEPSRGYGTGGFLGAQRNGAVWSGSVSGRWTTARLDLNDAGYLRSPDNINGSVWLQWRANPDRSNRLFRRGNVNFNANPSWMYAGRAGRDLHTGEEIWSYGQGHPSLSSTNLNAWTQLRSFWEVFGGFSYQFEGTQRYETRNTVRLQGGGQANIPGGGPLIGEPATYSSWLGFGTDSRKPCVFSCEGSYSIDRKMNVVKSIDANVGWNQAVGIRHEFGVHLETRRDDTQHLDNFENPGGGIGGVSYVFGEIHQETLDATLRTSVLFSRSQSLEVYAQPYLTNGSYVGARELEQPDTYDLVPYVAEGFDYRAYDFRYAAMNVNAVYRWEYRPGSTLFLVWTHRRAGYTDRVSTSNPAGFDNSIQTQALFNNEPENMLLAKVTYWLPI
jgi:hypothetical protein